MIYFEAEASFSSYPTVKVLNSISSAFVVEMFFSLQGLVASLAFTTIAFSAQVHGLVTGEASSELKGKRYVVKRDGVDHHVFEHEPTGSKIDFVKNSGICETTPGVNQYSGYFSVGRKAASLPYPGDRTLTSCREHEHVVLVL